MSSENRNDERFTKQERWTVLTTVLGSGLAFIEGSAVNLAVPALQETFGGDVLGPQWVIESYALVLAACMLLGGALCDRWGTRRVFGWGVAIFAAASLWCGIAGSLTNLVIARALQGLGGALLMPGSLALLGNVIARERRGKAIGIWSAFSAVSLGLGLVAGGWLIDNAGWRAIFLINVPPALFILWILRSSVPADKIDPDHDKVDWIGAITATLALTLLTYGIIESSRLGWKDPQVIFSLLGCLPLFVFFFFWESRTRDPMLPLALFQDRNFTGANLLTLLIYSSLGASLLFMPMNFLQIQHYTATQAGLAILPFVFIMAFVSQYIGKIVDKVGARILLTVGPTIAGLGYFLLVIPGTDAHYWRDLFPAIFLQGIGMSMTVTPLVTTVLSAAPTSELGIASGINNAASRLAMVLSVAIAGPIAIAVFGMDLQKDLEKIGVSETIKQEILEKQTDLAAIELPTDLPESQAEAVNATIADAFIASFRAIMILSGGIAILGVVLAYFMIGIKKKELVEQKEEIQNLDAHAM
ncbi:Multidrug resistance protein Stp [Planctomycetales bacterium 10988]|nr:Multidrug resistance protein Stp [Planctomycetales bacterium 10988]